MESISITVNGIKVDAKKGNNILEASQNAGIYIPSLCAHPDLPPLVGLMPTEEVFQGKVVEVELPEYEKPPGALRLVKAMYDYTAQEGVESLSLLPLRRRIHHTS